MNTSEIKKAIDDIIDKSFKVITNVYKYQKESDKKTFTVVPPPDNSYIIFPQKADNDTGNSAEDVAEDVAEDDTEDVGSDRISEQELRFIFVEQFNKSETAKKNGLFYSIETPTVNFYNFSKTSDPEVFHSNEHKNRIENNKDNPTNKKCPGRSANIDLVIFQKDGNQIKRVALIEFKAHNPKKADYRKDICKLINEESGSDCLKYFIQIINIKRNCNSLEESSTLQNIVEKKFVSLDRLHNEENKEYEIFYWCCNINKDNDTDNPVQSICGVIKDDKFELKKMRITIHRGINQIGGCITEIQSSSGTKILIDLGHNLSDADGQEEDEYDVPENLDRLLDGVSAVFYTHYHGDHIAFEAAVAKKGIDQYLGRLARKVKLKFYAHMKNVPQEESRKKFEAAFNAVLGFKEYYPDITVTVGDIRITPYYLSHSAADAYMFVIECDGRKVLHTGDFRDHGYIGKCLYGTLRKFVVKPKTDVLITEGTMISRGDERMMSEKELQDKAYGLMSDYKYAFVLCSSTDPDRLASFCQATIRHPGRLFIADGYQCKLLKAFTNDLYQKKNIEIYDFSKAQEYDESLFQNMIESGFTMLVRTSGKFKILLDNFMRMLPDEETVFIYSQFNGYITPGHEAYKADTDKFVHSHGWKFECLHTSGHASQETLAKVCNMVNPSAAIIPIHKESGSDFKSLDIDDALKDKVVEHNTIVDGIEIQVQ